MSEESATGAIQSSGLELRWWILGTVAVFSVSLLTHAASEMVLEWLGVTGTVRVEFVGGGQSTTFMRERSAHYAQIPQLGVLIAGFVYLYRGSKDE